MYFFLSRGKLHIIKQMEDNEQSRILEEEQRDQEAQQMLQYLEELQMEDYKVGSGDGWVVGTGGLWCGPSLPGGVIMAAAVLYTHTQS